VPGPKVVLALVIGFVVVVGGAMLLIGLAQGDRAEHIDVPPDESSESSESTP
jgi:hypothetical protein